MFYSLNSEIVGKELSPSQIQKRIIKHIKSHLPLKIKKCLYAPTTSGGAGGQATDMEIQVKEILKMKQNLTQIYVDHNSKGKTFEEFYNAMERDNFMSAQEALDFGLIDEIITNRS